MAEYDLTDQEAELINYVRGYDEDGEPIPNGMRLTIETRGDRCLVETRHGFSGPTLIGESGAFDSAWIDRCGGDLRFARADEVEEAVASIHREVVRVRPRLRLIQGGGDNGK